MIGCGLHHHLTGNMEYVTEWREPLRFSLTVPSLQRNYTISFISNVRGKLFVMILFSL